MARSFTNIKAISALVAQEFSNSLARRGYAATAQRGIGASMSGKKSGEEKVAAAEKVAWVPDPVTGYYKPENIKDIDAADMRATVLGKKLNH